ncbi:PGF-CTERM sorting domain-containing protein [Halobacterium zhouii]|uniref:PGF-CTERM sorting domain-containing protein n=1 Tax=Halobacterium zhouii TaxID=2902624 RepID=UPI001E3BBF78|nr:PGF-CTERM sorting domain-containing protein [Halobacterium zhouii]
MVSLTRLSRALPALVLVSLLLVPTGAVARSPVGDVAPNTVERTTSAEGDVAFARTIEEMKGHLVVSVQYAETGDTKAAARHASHPYAEYWSAVNATLREANATLASELATGLQNAPDRARNASASEYAAYVNDTVIPLLNDAKRAVVGDRAASAAFNAKVSRELLQRAVHEYGEGVSAEGTVTNKAEYADARGFAIRAEALYRSSIRQTLSEHARTELDEMFENLQTAIEDSKAPSDVKSITNGIAAEYAEYTGIEAQTGDTQVEKTVAEIEEHLHEAVEAYENGEPAKAKQIIRQTYLSYFEGLEGELIEKRPELVEELEADFNKELPALIEQNASVSEVRKKVEAMEEKLHTVEKVLSQGNETTISLDEKQTTTAGGTTDEADAAATDGTTGGSVPGFGAGVAVVAVVGAAFVALRRTN